MPLHSSKSFCGPPGRTYTCRLQRQARFDNRPVFIASGGAGVVPRLRARVTFGPSPKSDQKGCLKPQVSRLPARLQNLFCGNAFLALRARRQQRLNVELTFFYPRCRSCGKMQRCTVLHFRVKAAALRERSQFHISDESGRGGQRWKEIQKPWVFGGVLSPISFAAERNGAAGGNKKVTCARRRGMAFPAAGGNKKWVAPERETAPIRLRKEMEPPEAMKRGDYQIAHLPP